MPATPLITVDHLTISYGTNQVIRNANFKIYPGDFICIVGANGSGKSTLVKSLLGLLHPSDGKITYHNLKQNTIGYLPQENKISSIFPATVQEIVLSGALGSMNKKPFYGAKEKAHANNSLNQLHITNLKNQSFASLSGGQKQKVLLARALTATNQLLILDEPSNNLDYDSRQDFYQTLKQLNQSGPAILMITHDLDQDDLIGDQVLSIKNGRVTTSSTKAFLRSFQK